MEACAIGKRAMPNPRSIANRIGVGDAMQSPELMRAEVAAVIVEEMPLWERDASNNHIMFLRGFSN